MKGKDVKDEHRAVDDSHAVKFVLDIAYLGRGEFAVENRKIGFRRATEILKLPEFAGSDISPLTAYQPSAGKRRSLPLNEELPPG